MKKTIKMCNDIVVTSGVLAIICAIVAFIGGLATLFGCGPFIPLLALVGLVASIGIAMIATRIGLEAINEMEETEDWSKLGAWVQMNLGSLFFKGERRLIFVIKKVGRPKELMTKNDRVTVRLTKEQMYWLKSLMSMTNKTKSEAITYAIEIAFNLLK